MLAIPVSKRQGVSLVELLVGIAVGLLVIASVVATYAAIARSAGEILGSAKLNAELRAAMAMMVRDIRRAGSWTSEIDKRGDKPNPFTERMGSFITDINILDGGRAIQLSYNNLLGGQSGAVVGYREDGASIKTLHCNMVSDQPSACNTGTQITSGWERLTDENNIRIESLSFSTKGSRCHNITNPAQPKPTWVVASESINPACDPGRVGYVAATGDRLIEKRLITIKMTGKLKRGKEFTMNLEEPVQVANDRVLSAP